MGKRNTGRRTRYMLLALLIFAGFIFVLPAYADEEGGAEAEEQSSPYYAEDKWDLKLINADAAFSMGAAGEGVRIGLIDSGVNALSCLAGSILPGHNYITGGDESDTSDNYGHGTLVAALIAGSGNDGYIGAAPGAEIVPLKVTDGRSVSSATVVRAIYGAIDDYECDILNLSLGIIYDSSELRDAIAYAEEKGVVVVAAVGNNGKEGKLYPAVYESVIGVGAVDRNGLVSDRSNHNDSVFITAPGANVKTAGKNGGYVTSSGTSFAVPYVSAAAAVMLGLDPLLTPKDIASILAETACDKGTPGWDEYYGHGILDIGAVAMRLGGAEEPEERGMPCEFLSAYTLVNRTGEDLELSFFSAVYDSLGVCLSVARRDASLPAYGRMRIEPPEGEYYGQFVYETASMKPLAEAKKHNK